MLDTLGEDDLWADGAATAAGRAKAVKHLEQARRDDPRMKAIAEKVRRVLGDHELFQAAALPRKFARIMANRCRPGMGYGQHVDAAIIDGTRTDLSFTLFLSEPERYEGGALSIGSSDGETLVKLPAGALVLYPSSSLHEVEPVTSGERLAIVGWVQSRVRAAERRAILFDLELARRELSEAGTGGAALDRLANARNNLIRQWADG